MKKIICILICLSLASCSNISAVTNEVLSKIESPVEQKVENAESAESAESAETKTLLGEPYKISTNESEEKDDEHTYMTIKTQNIEFNDDVYEKYSSLKDRIGQFNKTIDDDVKDFKTSLKDAKESFKERPEYASPYEYSNTLSVVMFNDDVLIIANNTYYFTGGAHGSTVVTYLNYDLDKQKDVELKDVITDMDKFKEALHKKADEQKEDLFDDYSETIDKDLADPDKTLTFLIKDSSLIIEFGQYDIAPYSSGLIDFEFPYNEYKNMLNSKYFNKS